MSRFAFGLIAVLITTSSAFAKPQYEVTNLTEAFYADYNGSVAIENIQITCMNNIGQFAGMCRNTEGIEDGFLWQPGSAPTWFGINVPGTASIPNLQVFDINDSGEVTGSSRAESGLPFEGFQWELVSGIGLSNPCSVKLVEFLFCD